ncbi:enoyl-CoA hydratase/isomerase family protein [Streptomyces sp. LN245]|uniref:enoyl-CoA hydratase/isomerase family protein n=1 Tax=Streptomyces sp. LN245 TaxID=3112975 RepID=UPI00371D40BC
MTTSYETIKTRLDGTVLSATFSAPPMNLIGVEVVRDLVAMLEEVSHPAAPKVVIFDSADPDFFLPHFDMTKVPEYTAEAAKAGGPGDASLGMLFRKLSRLPAVTIAKLRGRARGAGSEFLLACDMRFASRENALLGQPEVGIGAPPGAVPGAASGGPPCSRSLGERAGRRDGANVACRGTSGSTGWTRAAPGR